MPKADARSTMLRLLEVGQRARQVLARPLIENGLQAGDDAVLLALRARLGASESSLAEALSAPASEISARVTRLVAAGFVNRHPLCEEQVAGLTLTEAGEKLLALVDGYWVTLETALFAPLDAKDLKRLSRQLKAFATELRGA